MDRGGGAVTLSEQQAQFAEDVRQGLCRKGQKELPSKYLYDALGSALFAAICELPEYGLTRADERLLQRCAVALAAQMPDEVVVAELGSGSGRKTKPLLARLCDSREVAYYPIEISKTALGMLQRELGEIPRLRIHGLQEEYLTGLQMVAERRREEERLLVLFLGSTIGNFGPGADVEFLRAVRGMLRPGDSLLLGTDLLKPRRQLLEAYDDPTGVTAAFNRNLLARINRELNADFDVRSFAHEAHFREETSSVEMHLRCGKEQTVRFDCGGFSVRMDKGETIWTESCRKYTTGGLTRLASEAGFRMEAQWVDEEWPFAESLLTAAVSGGEV